MSLRSGSPFWSHLVAVGVPIFRSELRRRATGAILLLATLLLTISALNVASSYVTRNFMTALADREQRRFYWMVGALVAVFAVSTTVAVLARYLEERLGLVWRDWLTRRFLDRYLRGRAYRRLAGRADLDNPDQRISEDVKTFSVSTLSLLIMAFEAALAIATFSGVLCSITPWLLVAAFGYAVLGSAGMFSLGRSLAHLNNEQFRREANFRYLLVRLREHSGAVAQMAGERDEKSRLKHRLQELVSNLQRIISLNRNLGFFSNGYNYLTQILPVVIVAPMYVRGQVEFGVVAQSVMAFTFTLNGFSLIVTQFQQLSSYAAVVTRLGTLWEATEDDGPRAAAAPLVAEVEPEGRRVAYHGVTLETPRDGRILVHDLSLELPEGRRLLVTGQNGAGKTALFLATAGLWERGHGHIVCPDTPHTMFLPQQPYAIESTLREHLLYGLDHRSIDDEQVHAILRVVGLEGVVARVGGLDAERDWSNVLSEGELQTCAVARLILAKPRFAFLDQALAVLGPSREEALYAALARTEITYVSIGDHPALNRFHDLRLELHGHGAWTITPT
jgi:vitamin B12/bleomycin/antimicrobial peptide transport system ATP-binding/permease protein